MTRMTPEQIQTWARLLIGPFLSAALGATAAYMAIRIDIAEMRTQITSIQKLQDRDHAEIIRLRDKMDK